MQCQAFSRDFLHQIDSLLAEVTGLRDALRSQDETSFLSDLCILFVFLFAEGAGQRCHFVLSTFTAVQGRTFFQLLVESLESVVDFFVLQLRRVLTLGLRHFVLSRHELLATPLWHFFPRLSDVGDLLRHFHLLLDFLDVPVRGFDLPDGSEKIFWLLVERGSIFRCKLFFDIANTIAELIVDGTTGSRARRSNSTLSVLKQTKGSLKMCYEINFKLCDINFLIIKQRQFKQRGKL